MGLTARKQDNSPHRRIKVRDLVQRLRSIGCVPVRSRGSHQHWSTPGGARLTIVVSHLGDEASPVVMASVRRVLRSEHLSP